jgi:hypothetical protein
MLLPREQSPWNCGYFLGAICLQALEESKGQSDLQDLQHRMSGLLNRAVSPTQVVAAAAWLFLIDAIRLEDDGSIVKCS